MKQNLAYWKARTNGESLRAVTLHCVSTPIKSSKANYNAVFFFRTFRTRLLGVETQCNFEAGFY